MGIRARTAVRGVNRIARFVEGAQCVASILVRPASLMSCRLSLMRRTAFNNGEG